MPKAKKPIIRAKSKISNDIVQRIVKAIKEGRTLKDACFLADICFPTYRAWYMKGEKQSEELYVESLNREGAHLKTDKFYDFYKAVEAASVHYKDTRVKMIEIAGANPERWHANAWILERKYPNEFGRLKEVHDRLDDTQDQIKELKQKIFENGLIEQCRPPQS